MGFLDRLLGRSEPEPYREERAPETRSDDERALERYRYLLRTAPPDRIEQAHEEAFAALTPEQRRQALDELSAAAPEERADGDDPRSLARMATRAEVRRPGTVERAFGGSGGMGVPLMGSFATAFLGTLAAQALFADLADGGLIDGADGGGDPGAGDAGGGDFAGGSDFGGGGDFGGGDFGGGF